MKHNNYTRSILRFSPLFVLIWIGCSSTPVTPDDKVVDVQGCMDSLAQNYSDLATLDDGSCQYLGCTDSTSTNFDPLANIDDGNCIPIEEIPMGWTLVWNDEFNTDSINTQKWNHENWWPGYVNNELQSYSDAPANSYIRSGILNIVMRKANPFDLNNPAYTSARMNSAGKGDWTYGRFEIKAKLPKGQGMWPAIWMMPTESVYGPWPVSGEIDIMESLGHETDRVYGTIHYGDYHPNHTSTGTSLKLDSGDFSTEFHVFSLEWDVGVLRWYVDDLLFQTRNSWFSVGGDSPAPFDQNFHIILNLALGGGWAGPPDQSTLFPQSMQVDYVRVYHK